MKTDTHFWPYLAQLFLEWEMLHTKIVEKIKTLFMFGTFFFSENHGFCDIIWIFFWEPERPQKKIWRKNLSLRVIKTTNTHTHNTLY